MLRKKRNVQENLPNINEIVATLLSFSIGDFFSVLTLDDVRPTERTSRRKDSGKA